MCVSLCRALSRKPMVPLSGMEPVFLGDLGTWGERISPQQHTFRDYVYDTCESEATKTRLLSHSLRCKLEQGCYEVRGGACPRGSKYPIFKDPGSKGH